MQGPALDAGSGPGHWTAFRRELGVEVTGLDLVPEFVARATTRFPHVKFCVGDLNSLPVGGGSLAGILSWYSVIHTAPEAMPAVLEEFSRVLRPGGTLLLGFFEGAQIASFDHAVHTAWFWPMSAMSEQLEHTGFEIVETHTRTEEGSRPHGAILARRVESVPVLASSNLKS